MLRYADNTLMNNIFDAIPNDIRDEVFDTLIDNTNIKIERIVSRGHRSPESGWYDQDKNEWVIVLKGSAVLSFVDSSTVSLNPGDYINLAAHQKHRVDWTDPDADTVWLAIHY